MLRYKINKISQVPLEKLSIFYKEVYKKRHKSLTNNWRWWYRAGHSPFEPLIISIDDQVIGQAGLLPADLNIAEKKVPAIWFVDFAILAKFQGKGFGKILVKEWMKICPNQITFCNNNSLKVFEKFGWENNLSTKRLAKPINILSFLPVVKKFKFNFANKTLRYLIKKKYSRCVSINPYEIKNNFKVINDSFEKRKYEKKNEFAEIIRDEKWLHWRLMECPYNNDIFFFEYKNNFAIVHIFLIDNVKKLNILFTYCTDNPQENELLAMIINWSINNDIDLVWAVNRDLEIENIFPKLFSKAINFTSWSSDQEIFKIIKKGLYNSQGIDSDIDSSLFAE